MVKIIYKNIKLFIYCFHFETKIYILYKTLISYYVLTRCNIYEA